MSIVVTKLNLANISQLSLHDLLLSPASGYSLPGIFQLEQECLLIESKICALAKPNIADAAASVTTNSKVSSAIELVVFATLNLGTFIRLIQASALKISHLVAINNRNNLQSFRFIVNCDDIEIASKAVSDFALAHHFEAALLKDAPTLSQPGLIVMDMDSTTITIECIDEIAKLVGVGAQVAEVTELAMQGKLDFAQSLLQRVATLENAPASVLAEVVSKLELMPGLLVLLETLTTHQWRIAIASGGFTYFAEHLKQRLALDAVCANELEIIDGKLTGKVLGKIVDARVKAQCVQQLAQQYNIGAAQTVAVGDGANDLLMMAEAQLGVAFHAKPIVLAKADSCINFSGLELLLHWLR